MLFENSTQLPLRDQLGKARKFFNRQVLQIIVQLVNFCIWSITILSIRLDTQFWKLRTFENRITEMINMVPSGRKSCRDPYGFGVVLHFIYRQSIVLRSEIEKCVGLHLANSEPIHPRILIPSALFNRS